MIFKFRFVRGVQSRANPTVKSVGVKMYRTTHLADPQIVADPYPIYSSLIENDPIAWSDSLKAWCVMTYADCVEVLKHCDLRAQRMESVLDLKFPGERLPEDSIYHRFTQNVMMYTDPPLHDVLRRATNAGFTREAHAFYAKAIEQVTADLVDSISHQVTEIDAVELLTSPLPVQAAIRAFGVPEEDLSFVLPRVSAIMTYWSGPQEQPIELSQLLVRLEELHEYSLALVQAQRGSVPEGTAIARLAAVDIEEAGVSLDQVIHQLVLLLIALFAPTTPGSASSGLLAFAKNPRQVEIFRDDPDAAANAASEVFRYNSSNQFTWRVASRDVEIGGQHIAEGEAVVAFLASANRDPSVFQAPDRFDLKRANSAKHLSFGIGLHACLGRQIAAIEIQSFFAALFRRFSRVELVGEPIWNENLEFRSLSSLPVSLS